MEEEMGAILAKRSLANSSKDDADPPQLPKFATFSTCTRDSVPLYTGASQKSSSIRNVSAVSFEPVDPAAMFFLQCMFLPDTPAHTTQAKSTSAGCTANVSFVTQSVARPLCNDRASVNTVVSPIC